MKDAILCAVLLVLVVVLVILNSSDDAPLPAPYEPSEEDAARITEAWKRSGLAFEVLPEVVEREPDDILLNDKIRRANRTIDRAFWEGE